eukprot:TRINITY_DN4688_c0_g1_i2.p1 TRINITY_DN4688_c0_g1~~TRINITY_DN4688_c0_g1_i2.p1  ORF type:complete len:139 (+),score=22.61 TRINITY_DN4688_c0_g1_i2:316-732(+)
MPFISLCCVASNHTTFSVNLITATLIEVFPQMKLMTLMRLKLMKSKKLMTFMELMTVMKVIELMNTIRYLCIAKDEQSTHVTGKSDLWMDGFIRTGALFFKATALLHLGMAIVNRLKTDEGSHGLMMYQVVSQTIQER